jgi:hypothetical protein
VAIPVIEPDQQASKIKIAKPHGIHDISEDRPVAETHGWAKDQGGSSLNSVPLGFVEVRDESGETVGSPLGVGPRRDGWTDRQAMDGEVGSTTQHGL